MNPRVIAYFPSQVEKATMLPGSSSFKENAAAALADANLQAALKRTTPRFAAKRAAAIERLPEFEALRDAAMQIKNHAIAHLDFYLETYADAVERAGGKVHWCATADDARKAVLKICQDTGAKTVTKGKSMVTEEIGLNRYLEANGVTPVETDLGEYILQLRDEPPSHIIGPAFHLHREDWEESFRKAHTDLPADRIFRAPRHPDRSARQAAREIPHRRCRHHRRQFPDRGNRQQRHRHQRGQWRPDADPAARARGGGQHRERCCRRSRTR
jgi:L-lactate dehydrogenase complex protein LldF